MNELNNITVLFIKSILNLVRFEAGIVRITQDYNYMKTATYWKRVSIQSYSSFHL